jgi:hypothetical protein
MKNNIFSFCLIFCFFSSTLLGSPTPQGEEILLAFHHPALENVYVNCMYSSINGQMYLPVTELFNLLEVNYQPDIINFTVKGNYLKSENPYDINLSTMNIRLGNKDYPLTPDDFRIGEMDFYLSPAIFEKVFELEFTVNINYLTLTLTTDKVLPVVEKQKRENARKKLDQQQSGKEDSPLAYNRKRKVIGGGMLDYVINTAFENNFQNVDYSISGGMEVLGGDIQGTVSGNKASDGSNNLQTNNLLWHYVVRSNPYFSRFSVGQLSTTGLQSWQIKGIAITNNPIQPRKMFNSYIIDGNTEAESEVELYLNEQLINYKRADELGYYRFDAPISYGTSRVSIKIYTPQGELKVIDREIQVPFTFLPKGVVTYNVQAGVGDNTYVSAVNHDYVGHGDVAAGITNWLTASAGAEYTGKKLLPSNPLLYGSLSARVAKQYLMDLDFAPNSLYRFSGSVLYATNSSVNVIYTHFTSKGSLNTLNATDDISANLYLPLKLLGMSCGLRLSGEHTLLESSSSTRYTADLSARIGVFNFRLNYNDNFISKENVNYFGQGLLTTAVTYTIAHTPGIPVYVSGMFLRGQGIYDVRNNQFTEANLQLSRTLLKTGRLNITLTRNLIQNVWTVQVGLSIDLKFVRSITTFNSVGKEKSLVQSFNGSLGFDARNANIEALNRAQVGQCAASVILFIDNNNNGIYDKGDEILPYKAVSLDNPTVMNIGKDGILRLSQLQSYFKYNLKVNRTAIPDPTLVPMKDEFSFITDPNQYKNIEIPFCRGGTINGSVFVDKDNVIQPQGGLRLFLKGVDSKYEETIRTFNDGGFYAMDLPTGKYTLEVDPAQLGFLMAKPKDGALKFEIKALSDGDALEGLKIVLIPEAVKSGE